MNILLINDNPVVSRLLALCTRGEHIGLDEVKHVDGIEDVRYDILFVDDASYVDYIDYLLEDKRIRKKVFISYNEEKVKGFDETIKKPFLPSQIMKVIESVNMSEDFEDNVEENISIFPISKEEEIIEKEVLPDIFPLPIEDEEIDDISEPEENVGTEILNSNEIEKIKALLDMDDEIDLYDNDELLSDDEYEARKVKVIKEQLIADGLEIVEEDEIVEELSSVALDTDEQIDKKKTLFNDDELSRIEDAVMVALEKLKPKKIKKLLKGKKIEIKIKLEDDD
ncbi:hypothetical protein [Sulfurovum sp.]|uniref:hypothetical protein n=1 Tax=Sulfurovum sp. TaxID=1969726 RepID=UPI003561E4CB